MIYSQRFPLWFKQEIPDSQSLEMMRKILETRGLHTVCQSAKCPNTGRCWKDKTATFMILGNVCTRRCRFCAVNTGEPLKIDYEEPQKIAQAVAELQLKYVVVTSVTRDDLEDKGAGQFSETIKEIRKINPQSHIEVLVPDFLNDQKSLLKVIDASPDVIGHNMEMPKRFYATLRPQALYARSLSVLKYFKTMSTALIKSGFMVGLGETQEEIQELINDLASVGCDILTIGQYLAPSDSSRHVTVKSFVSLEEFEYYKDFAIRAGIKKVLSGPLVRSSFLAEELFENCQQDRLGKIDYALQ